MTSYDPRTALVVVDVQNDFADPAGGLSVAGGDAVVPIINAEVQGATEAGAVTAFTQDWHPEAPPHFAKDGGIWPVHCVADTWGAELHPDLVVPPDAIRVRKGANGEDGYSGFTMRDAVSGQTIATELEARLREAGVERVVVVGLATDYCVKNAARDALAKGFGVEVDRAGVRGVDVQPGDVERAFEEIRAAGGSVT